MSVLDQIFRQKVFIQVLLSLRIFFERSLGRTSFDNIFQKMFQIQIQTLKKLLHQNQISQQALKQMLLNLGTHFEMQKLFAIVAELSKNISNNVQPFVRVNAITIAYQFLKLADYPYMLLAEVYLMPHIQNIIEFATNNITIQNQTLFFRQQGYSSSIPHLQNLSYNFVATCCRFVQLAAQIKPLKVYQGHEYAQDSVFRKNFEKLQRSKQNNQFIAKFAKNKQNGQLRQIYLYSLSKWNDYQNQLLQFYIKIIEDYLCTGVQQQKYKLSFYDMLKYGEPIITSEIIARLAEIVSSSCNFKVRARALKLIDSFILWGDLQALLVVNFTQHMQIVVKNIMYINGETNINEGAKIYPQIIEQQQEKLQFYISFLRCLQTWAECYPKNDYFEYKNKTKSANSAIYRLYRFLKQIKKFKFPQNLTIARYEKESHTNMKEKMMRNQMILIDIINQTESVSILVQDQKQFQQVQQFYQTHKKLLLSIMNHQNNELSYNMNKLFNFKLNFENYVQSIQQISSDNQSIDRLIQNGLELIDMIQLIHQPYIKYLKGQYKFQYFQQVISNVCLKYYNIETKGQSQVYFRRFLSQKLKIKREELTLIKARSVLQQIQFKIIVNDLNVRQLRNKYKKKREKMQDVDSPQSSVVLNLEIYTKTKLPNSSNHGNQDFPTEQTSLKKIVEKKCQKINPQNYTSKNMKSEGKNSKKKIAIISKQLTKTQASSKQSEVFTDNTNNKAQNKLQSKKIYITLEQNYKYYECLQRQELKYSYTLAHIIIYKSQQLTVERVITQVIQNNKIKVKLFIIVVLLTDIQSFKYNIQDEACIHINDKTQFLPKQIKSLGRYVIELVGQMKKIPLKLPSITLYVDSRQILKYVLPFTINFFLDCYSNQTQVLANYKSLESAPHYEFISEKFRCSDVLFPQGKTDKILIYFPFILKLPKAGEKKDAFIWEVKHNDMKFLIVVQSFENEGEMSVIIYTSEISGQTFLSFFKYLLNWFTHLLGGFSLKKK